MRELFLATTNQGKAREIQSLLDPLHIKVVTGECPPVEETGLTFEDNALLKARAGVLHSGLPTLADDSGLCVWALGGSPGIFSSRWATENNNYQKAFNKIEEGLERINARNRLASFICVLAYCWPQDQTILHKTFEGRIDGEIIKDPRGEEGFGYDPIFVPEGLTQTFAEMGKTQKEKISHRTRAFAKFSTYIQGLA